VYSAIALDGGWWLGKGLNASCLRSGRRFSGRRLSGDADARTETAPDAAAHWRKAPWRPCSSVRRARAMSCRSATVPRYVDMSRRDCTPCSPLAVHESMKRITLGIKGHLCNWMKETGGKVIGPGFKSPLPRPLSREREREDKYWTGASPHFSPGLLRASCPPRLRGQRRCAPLFTIAPGDFVGILGRSGKADWSIARRGIAVAMAQGGSAKLQSQSGPKTE